MQMGEKYYEEGPNEYSFKIIPGIAAVHKASPPTYTIYRDGKDTIVTLANCSRIIQTV